MLPSLRPLTNFPASALLVLAAMAIQWSAVHAQQNDPNSDPPYYYWLSPGRIAGIAVGAIVLIFLILSMLILACRRRRHSKETSKVMVSNFPGQPQPYPSWREAQQPVQTPYGPDATNMGWYYPAQGTVPFDQAKSAVPSGQAQRTKPSEQVPSAAPFGEVQRSPPSGQAQRTKPSEQVPSAAPFGEVQRPPSDQMQRPAPTSQGPGTSPSDQVQKPASTSQALRTPTSGQVQRTAPSVQVQRPPSTSQVQTTVPSGQVQATSPPSQVQSTAPTGRPQSAAPLVRAQEQGIPIPPPPRRAHTKGTLSSGTANDVDSPPPYYPPTGPLTSPP